ncbi:WG containing repeat-containing protein [Butyrivibrio fibrisolvens DSM 3071]|uniref:WG containing repeat-containing protein n=1 Tax=Butyrivibrio fibrisolvens DSM 3071 TaxID=1121131 RepID=A0A1M5ZGU5_BUTFI|nr:WG repeat-containing protein [Butyrivibrio fibrisolvens]SHI23418.1 WG containing repeat-containing protein [Butyrivibrio fibrisolvens DSM 3071]
MSTYEKRLKEDLKILGGFLIAAVIISAIFIYLNSCNKGPTRYVLDTEGNIICSHKSTEPLDIHNNNTVTYTYTNNWSERSKFYNRQSGIYNFETNKDSDTLTPDNLTTDNYISSFWWDFFYNSPKDFAINSIYEMMYHSVPYTHTNYSCTLNNGDVYLLDHRSYYTKYGIANKFGIWVDKPDYDYLDTSYIDKGLLFVTTSTDLKGVMNLEYKWIIEPNFSRISIDNNDTYIQVMKKKDGTDCYGAYDFDGHVILDADYSYIHDFGSLLYFDKKDNGRHYCGICDLNGNIILEPSYEDIDIDESSERIITEDSDGNYMLLDFSGNDVLGESFKYIECLKQSFVSNIPSFFIIQDNNGKYYICDKDGNKLADSQYDYLDSWVSSDDYIIAEIDGKRGLIDRLGNIYINFEYKEIIRNYNTNNESEDNCIVITEDDCVGIVDYDNKTVINPQKYKLSEIDENSDYYYAYDADIMFFPYDINNWVILSSNSEPVEIKCDYLEYLGSGIFKACKYHDQYCDSVIDYKGQFICELRQHDSDVSVSTFNEKPLIAIISGCYGSIFYDGSKVLDIDDYSYHCISNSNGTVLFWTTAEAKVYSADGEYLGIIEDPDEGQKSLLVVKDESTGLYGLVGKNGELLLDYEYKYIETSCIVNSSHDNKSELVAVVKNKKGKYGIFDANGNWIYEPQFDWVSLGNGFIQVTLRWGQKVKK